VEEERDARKKKTDEGEGEEANPETQWEYKGFCDIHLRLGITHLI
jgi:hypothetical protein